jgi:hypothetical protein
MKPKSATKSATLLLRMTDFGSLDRAGQDGALEARNLFGIKTGCKCIYTAGSTKAFVRCFPAPMKGASDGCPPHAVVLPAGNHAFSCSVRQKQFSQNWQMGFCVYCDVVAFHPAWMIELSISPFTFPAKFFQNVGA